MTFSSLRCSLQANAVQSHTAKSRSLAQGPHLAQYRHEQQQHRSVFCRVEPRPDAKNGEADSKKTLSREAEPEEYWSPPGERKGANPMKDPLAIIGVVSILFPFIILGIAVGTGVIDTSVYR